MNSKTIEYSNGKMQFVGELFWDGSREGKRPGVVVFPEAFGLNDHTRERAERLAGLGYIALAADFHGEGRVFSDMESLGPKIQGLFGDRDDWRSRAQAALDVLVAQPTVDANKVAAIGFCFGGATCFELARTGAALKAIVTFHAGLLPELSGDAGCIQGKVLVCHGADDPLVKQEAIDAVMEELRRDKVDWQFMYYGNALHGFTNPAAKEFGIPGVGYEATTEARSWKLMCDLFAEVF